MRNPFFEPLIVALACCPWPEQPRESAPEDMAARVLERSRAAVLQAVETGGWIECDLAFQVLLPNGRMVRFHGDLRTTSEGASLTVAPSFDPLAPLGEASSQTRLELAFSASGLDYRVFGQEMWGAEARESVFPLPPGLEAPYSPMLVPRRWSNAEFTLRETRVDPHALFAAADDHGHDAEGTEGPFFVLLSAPRTSLDEVTEGQIELWMRAGSGFVERIVIAAGPKDNKGEDQVFRAIISFTNIRIHEQRPRGDF